MSSHVAKATLLKHYKQEAAAKERREQANVARKEAFEATRRAIKLEVDWWRMSQVGWAIAWLTTLAVVITTALRWLE